MSKRFTVGGQLVDPERYDQLVDKFPKTFGPRVEYFQALRREKEENERLAFLLEVSSKPSSILLTSKEAPTPLLSTI